MQGWKTLLFAIILAIVGALEAFDWAQVVPEGWEGIVLAVVGVVVGYLRQVTTTPSALATKSTVAKAKTQIEAMAAKKGV